MRLDELNKQERKATAEIFFTCCGSSAWVDGVMQGIPFATEQELIKKVTTVWYQRNNEKDWREAFAHHPKIGDQKGLREKYQSTIHLAGAEQAGVNGASEDVIVKLVKANEEYEKKFGFIFIVFATGKTAEEMLRLLEDRLKNSYEEELIIAMGEQHKITILRLQKILNDSDWKWMRESQLTSHVLDTSTGKPGYGITIQLQTYIGGNWLCIAQGVTNRDGRVAGLLAPERILPASNYKLVFDTGSYFKKNEIQTFYPLVEVLFSIFDDQHYHVPLLINPFGYSTYRGS